MVTVASLLLSSIATGMPTMFERPTCGSSGSSKDRDLMERSWEEVEEGRRRGWEEVQGGKEVADR